MTSCLQIPQYRHKTNNITLKSLSDTAKMSKNVLMQTQK